MNLLDRLKKPAIDKLNLANNKYPEIIDNIFESLETNEYYTEITFGIWTDIQFFTGAEHPSDIFIDCL